MAATVTGSGSWPVSEVDVRSTDGEAAPAAADAEAEAGRQRPRRRSLLVLVPALVVAVVVVFLVVVVATREPAANRVVDSPLVGKPAPALSGPTLDGGTFDLADRQGQFTLVNFFATWCAPCVREHDDLVAFDRRHRAAGDASVVSVVFGDSVENARRFFDENGGEFPVVTDDGGDIALDFGVAKVPESYLVGPRGVVLAKIVGGVTDEGLDELLLRVQGLEP
jgi:cytochrome c biogenesis protein CcmG/thiol:disulfide interchange protein DsbE